MRVEPGGVRRWCQSCREHVHDISAMDERQAKAFLAASAGLELCLAYDTDERGAIVFDERTGTTERTLVPAARLRRRTYALGYEALAGVGALSLLLTACTPHGTNTSIRIQDDVAATDASVPTMVIPAAPPPTASPELTPEPPAAEPCDPLPPPRRKDPIKGKRKRVGVLMDRSELL